MVRLCPPEWPVSHLFPQNLTSRVVTVCSGLSHKVSTFIYESFMLLSARLYEMTENCGGGGAIISSGSFCADTACSARVSVDSFWVIHLRAQRCGVRLTGNCSFTATLLRRLNAKF